jgi:membrane peptidoglycan carboxypeptidase
MQAALFVTVSVLSGVLVAGLVLPFVGSAGMAARSAAQSFDSLPSVLQTPPLPQQSVLVTADGKALATVYTQNRIVVPLANISPLLQRATVAVEDARFYQHDGVDVRGTVRAVVTNLQAGEVEEGGSTLTQQYVRNVLQLAAEDEAERRAATEQTAARKLREMRYAIGLEKRISKSQILEGYLNIAYFGAGAYGAEAAARRFYSVSAKDLTLAQAATLAGLVQSPVAYDPLRRPDLAQRRRDVVLQRMLEQGMITPDQYRTTVATSVKDTLKPRAVRSGCSTSRAPFFCDYVLSVIANDAAFGKTPADRQALLTRGGLVIRTTLDSKTQAAAQQAVDTTIPRDDRSRKAAVIVMVEPGTGAIKAMAQNRSYGNNPPAEVSVNYAVGKANHGLDYGVQAGSTFKPFVLAAALEDGIPLNTRIASPSGKKFTQFTNCATGARYPTYAPKNSTGSGTFDLRSGTALSVNTFFVELEQRVGLCRPAEITEALGLRDYRGKAFEWKPSTVLGTEGVTPLGMAEAYATFAASGVHCDSLAITAVSDRSGRKLAVPPRRCTTALDPAIADGVTSLLAGVIDGPIGGRTGKAMSLGRPAAGKTGTIDNNGAVWFVGYTPQLSTAVAVFDPRGAKGHELRNITINGRYYSRVYGGTLPGPIWREAMRAAHEDLPVKRFPLLDPSIIKGSTVQVPSLVGLSSTAARAQLESLGLLVQIADTRVASGAPEGTVAYSSPRAGASVTSGTTVRLYLSTGVAPPPSPSPSASPSGTPVPAPSASPSP